MRVMVFVALKLLLLEIVLAFACCAGYFWLRGGWPGTALVLGVVALIVAPWLGDLRVDYDSGAGTLQVRLAWWAAMQMRFKAKETRFRFLFITWRTHRRETAVGSRKSEARSRKRRGAGAGKAMLQNLGGFTRMALAAVQALLTLLGEAKELKVRAQGLTQIEQADRVLGALVGAREYGPLDFALLQGGKRKVEVHYRIGLLRACLAAEYALLEARPKRTLRAFQKARREAAEAAAVDSKEAE